MPRQIKDGETLIRSVMHLIRQDLRNAYEKANAKTKEPWSIAIGQIIIKSMIYALNNETKVRKLLRLATEEEIHKKYMEEIERES